MQRAQRILLTNATLVDPANGINGVRDIAIEGDQIAAVADHIDPASAAEVIDLDEQVAVPGIIDTHVHVCRPFGGPHGFRMMAKVGVTTAIDLAGYPDMVVQGVRDSGCGLNMGYVFPIIPGETVSGVDPDEVELRAVCDNALRQGALGLKVLGGHYPLTPDATARVLDVATKAGAHVAVHAGSTATGSNIDGVFEALELAAGTDFQLAHVNSYCRGQVTGDPIEEAAMVLKRLRAANVMSESYLGLINGAVATCENGIPKSNVVKTCLATGGFEATLRGMEDAIRAGWALINRVLEGETRLLEPDEGLSYFREAQTKVGVSFPVNSPGAAIAIATDRRAARQTAFTVDAISTDGGAYPRNTIVSQGLSLVRFGALSIDDFAIKTSVNPARMFGLKSKGRLNEGADADVTVLDLVTGSPQLSISRGQMIMRNSSLLGKGGSILVREPGEKYVRESAPGVSTSIVSTSVRK